MMQHASSSPRFVVTGPTGWIGRALLAMLYRGGCPDAIAGGEGVAAFGSRHGTIQPDAGPELAIRPLSSITPDDVAGAHVIHLAYLTKDKVAEMGEEEFFRTNRLIDDQLLTAMQLARPASLFVASSGAASLAAAGVDRHPYGLAKLEQEARFRDWADDASVPLLCGRIFNIAGPHINKLEAYAVSNFAVQALEHHRILVQASQPVFRSFLHVDDLCRIIIRAGRLRLDQRKPVDLCGNEIVEMSAIAALVADAIAPDIAIERPELNYNSHSNYLGAPEDTCLISMRLAVDPVDLRQQVRDTVNWISEQREMAARAFEI